MNHPSHGLQKIKTLLNVGLRIKMLRSKARKSLKIKTSILINIKLAVTSETVVSVYN